MNVIVNVDDKKRTLENDFNNSFQTIQNSRTWVSVGFNSVDFKFEVAIISSLVVPTDTLSHVSLLKLYIYIYYITDKVLNGVILRL